MIEKLQSSSVFQSLAGARRPVYFILGGTLCRLMSQLCHFAKKKLNPLKKEEYKTS